MEAGGEDAFFGFFTDVAVLRSFLLRSRSATEDTKGVEDVLWAPKKKLFEGLDLERERNIPEPVASFAMAQPSLNFFAVSRQSEFNSTTSDSCIEITYHPESFPSSSVPSSFYPPASDVPKYTSSQPTSSSSAASPPTSRS